MKKLLIALLLMLNCAYAQERAVIGCRILLDADEYTRQGDSIFIKDDTVNAIFENFKAWEMLDFHVFIYVECPNCHGIYLADHGCTNPNCPGRIL